MESIPDFLNKLEMVSSESTDEFESFKKAFTEKVAYLLDNRPNDLFNFFYRFDIDEEKVKSAIFSQNSQSSASILCDLVIKRALEKIETRKKYKAT